ncbi:MAG: NADP-dependent phosphogluconate dehydrogenase [Bacteroidales bacterium]
MNKNHNFGVFGLGVMGASLAKNIERNGFPTVVYNYTYDLTEQFMSGVEQDRNFTAARTVYEFIHALERPRRILLMVTAGRVVDEVIKTLKPFLDPGDILIDGGNSHYSDTDRRIRELEGTGIQYMGMGISGGEQGALWGPSLMPGGNEGTYHYIRSVLESIAAKVDDGSPCVTYTGTGSAGHFVKMVHNGIEYGDMQLIAEAYDILRFGLELSPDKIAEVFHNWNQGKLNSYLIEITGRIVNFPDDQKKGVLLDSILDEAGMKGTGTWTSMAALTYGEPIPTIIAALHGRALSSLTGERQLARSVYPTDVRKISDAPGMWIDKIGAALYTSKICSYAQGFALLRIASDEKQYGLNLANIAAIWRGGCIIRAGFLDMIKNAYADRPDLINLLLHEAFNNDVIERIEDWREVVSAAVKAGISLPAMSASLAYFEAIRRELLPANLIQAQRDYFGAHTYNRRDREGTFHTEWES